MAYDCRVFSGFERHPKFIEIRESYGSDGVLGVIILWGYAAEYRPSGVLHGMSRQGILRACQIEADRTDYVDFLVRCRILDYDEGTETYSIHNWEQRQPNCYNRERISAQKREAVNARWAKEAAKKTKRQARQHAKKIKENDGDTPGLHPVYGVQYPNPTQPSKKRDSLSTLSRATAGQPEGERECAIFFELAHEAMPTATLKTPERWAEMLQGLLDQGQDVAEVEAVMQFGLHDSFWRSRILTVKAFSESYGKMLDQMQQASAIQFPETVPQNGKSMTVEEWESLKQQQKAMEAKGKIEPP